MASWALQDAKARLSALVEMAASHGPQVVTRRGRDAVVVMGVDQFEELTHRGKGDDLVEFFNHSPLCDLPSGFLRRDKDFGREVAL